MFSKNGIQICTSAYHSSLRQSLMDRLDSLQSEIEKTQEYLRQYGLILTLKKEAAATNITLRQKRRLMHFLSSFEELLYPVRQQLLHQAVADIMSIGSAKPRSPRKSGKRMQTD